MGKKKKYEIEVNSSLGGQDTFSMSYHSLITSEQFQRMKPAVKLMYYYCRNQATSREGRACLYKHAEEEGKKYKNDSFVFPAAHMEKYGMQRQNGNKYLKELERNGFIEKVENNKHRRKVNVYRFSPSWKEL